MPESKDSIIFRSAPKTDVELALLFSQVDVWACPDQMESFDGDTPKLKELEHVLIEKVEQLSRGML